MLHFRSGKIQITSVSLLPNLQSEYVSLFCNQWFAVCVLEKVQTEIHSYTDYVVQKEDCFCISLSALYFESNIQRCFWLGKHKAGHCSNTKQQHRSNHLLISMFSKYRLTSVFTAYIWKYGSQLHPTRPCYLHLNLCEMKICSNIALHGKQPLDSDTKPNHSKS